ncbi:hypothetical protein FS749_013664 [Ceratobasidium sp. UAMH 11750]|nr:hypothetical protein FS749_013664 [Ceratobasidium sp. UAMH 11750]
MLIAEHLLRLDWSYNTGSAPYGNRWRKQRRMTHDVLKNSVNGQHFARMEAETRAMLKRMLDSPHANFEKEVRRNIAAQIMSTVYGYTVTSSDDYFVRSVQTVIENFSHAALPGNFLVNLIPWLKYVPEWVPGTEWKRTIRGWRQQRDSIIQETYDWAKAQISDGTAEPSMVRTHLANISQDSTVDLVEEEDCLKWAASTLFGAGSDTTVSSTMSFVLAMLQHPEIQARAQEEIDHVVGLERLPEVEDRASMPYMQAIVREVLRWQPVLRLAFPRASTKDDIYREYFIPKGSVVMLNVWAITRDESVYANPDTFDPDRFLDSSIPDAPGFGLGRRMCPGNSFAEASLFIMFASLLAVFNIKPVKDAVTGKELIPETKMTTNALVSHPLPFDCTFEPRSTTHKKLAEDFI